jgi:GAF domain-containing protein/HAMP domain-containing protein
LDTSTTSLVLARILPVGGFILVIVVVIGLLLTNRLANPIRRLATAAQQIGAGQWDAPLPRAGRDEIGVLSQAFSTMTAQLRDLYAGLEEKVATRTRDLERRSIQLEAATQVARGAAAIRDVDQLLEETVHLISDSFGFYHAAIFLLDEAREYAILQAASSEGGQRMLARRHQLKVGEVGIVGYAAGTGEPRIALDVGADAAFFDNPDLPQTRSEMALPLQVRDRVIGVLDVQSREPAAFSEEDVAVLQTMADQVALAIENARLLEEAEGRLREISALLRRQGQEGWERLAARRPRWGYTYDGVEVMPRTAASAVETEHQLTVPLQVRGTPIGNLSLVLGDRPPTSDETVLAQAVADQVSQALERARLFQETQRTLGEMEALAEIGRATGSVLDLGDVLRLILAQLERIVPYNTVALWLREGNTMRIHAARGFETPEAFIGFAAPIQEDKLFSELVLNRQPVIIADAQHDERFRGFADTEWVRSWLGVPLLSKGEVVGLLTIDKREPNFYTAEAARLTFAFGQQVALAIENARMFEETQRRAERERMIGEVTGRMRASLDLESVLKTAADEIYQALGLDEIVIRLATEETRDRATPKSLAADRIGTRPLGEEVV